MDNLVTTVGEEGQAMPGRGAIVEHAGKLKAPSNIIMSAQAARTYYNNFRQSHVERIRLYAAIEGLIAGNPPYDTAKLEAAGLSHIANVNTLDADGLYSRAALTFWNLVNQTENLIAFSVRRQGLSNIAKDLDYSGWAEIMARNWTKVIKEQWEDFIPEMNVLTGQLVKFGVSPIVWPDEQDFRWRTVDINRFFIADATPVTTADWSAVCVETLFTMQYLFSVYENFKDVEDSPWDMEALKTFIMKKANHAYKGQTQQFTDYLDLQRRLQNGDLDQGQMFSDTVRLVSLLYKEYSGKVSHFLFDPNGEVDNFLFKVPEQYESFSEALVVFTYSPGERYIHGNRGVGHKIFPACQALMQLDCHILDMAKISATPIIASQPTVGRDTGPIRFIPGVATDIGTAQFQVNNMGANISQLVPVANYMESKVNKNAIISGDDPSRPDMDRGSKSAPEVQMQSIKEFGVGKQNVAHFYKTLDIVFRQMTAKMLHAKKGQPGYELAQEWKDLCEEEGVPPEVFETKDTERNQLPRHISVRAARVAGDGSNLGLIMGLNGVGQIAGGFGAKGQYNYRKDIITSRLGIDYVERYLSDSNEPDESAGGASLATLENIAMKGGESPQATADNQHKAHVGSHLALVTNMIKAIQAQEMDPTEADKVFAIALPHTAEHISYLGQDPLNRGFIEQITPSWRQIQKFAQLNRARAQKMMQAEIRRRDQAEQKLSAEEMDQQREDMKMQREEQRKDVKVAAQVERAKEASRTRAEVMRESVKLKAENDRTATELKAENEREKNRTQTPQEILAGESTADMQETLRSQVGQTPNPADFK